MKFLFFLLISGTVLAHGENHPGPHGGVIRMPGPFHTELVVMNPRTFKVYLLDMKFKSPMTEQSAVSAVSAAHEAQCLPEKEYFLCKFDHDILESTGLLEIRAQRNKVKGSAAKYPLPQKNKK